MINFASIAPSGVGRELTLKERSKKMADEKSQKYYLLVDAAAVEKLPITPLEGKVIVEAPNAMIAEAWKDLIGGKVLRDKSYRK